MAGNKSQNLRQFYRLLRARGVTLQTLATAIGLQRHSYVSRMVHGHGRRRDGVYWPRLRSLLTPAELALIDTQAASPAFARAPQRSEDAPPSQKREMVYAYPTVSAAVAALAAAATPEDAGLVGLPTATQESPTRRPAEDRPPAPSADGRGDQHPLRPPTLSSRFIDWRTKKSA